MTANRLQRTYVLQGLDRVLYSHAPEWAEGTFVQVEEDSGRLVLWKDDIRSTDVLDRARVTLDRMAERFRLAIAKRIGCPLKLKLEKSDEPNFDASGVLRAHGNIGFSAMVTCTVLPQNPPAEIEQISEASARWISTLAETKNFGTHADEIVKRLYLLIEELKDEHLHQLSEEQRAALRQVKWVRDFVSHSTCKDTKLCAFIESRLPRAIVSTDPPIVRYDRTDIQHKNFVGQFEPIVRDIATTLLNAGIAAISRAELFP